MKLYTDEGIARVKEAIDNLLIASTKSNQQTWRDVKQDVIEALALLDAGKSVEVVAWMDAEENYSVITTRQKESNEFQYSPKFLAGHTIPLFATKEDV